MRRAGRDLAAAILLLLLLAALATAKSGDARLYPPRPGNAVVIYLVDNGDHSDLAVPRAELAAHGGVSAKAALQTTADPWVLVGWGDERFYEGEGPFLDRIPDGLRALFGARNSSVVHLLGVARAPDASWGESVRHISLSRAGLAAMLARLDRSFQVGPGGDPVVSPSTRDRDEAFFKSVEPFSLLHLCNHWTAELLNAAGLPTTPVLDTLPVGLWLDLKLRAGLDLAARQA